jgi:hypothetical protein
LRRKNHLEDEELDDEQEQDARKPGTEEDPDSGSPNPPLEYIIGSASRPLSPSSSSWSSASPFTYPSSSHSTSSSDSSKEYNSFDEKS